MLTLLRWTENKMLHLTFMNSLLKQCEKNILQWCAVTSLKVAGATTPLLYLFGQVSWERIDPFSLKVRRIKKTKDVDHKCDNKVRVIKEGLQRQKF